MTTKSGPEIDLSFYFGERELFVVLRSLFSDNSAMYQETDKSVLKEEIRKLCSLVNESNDDPITDAIIVIVFDGMAMVNCIIIKKSKLSTCRNFAESFFKVILLHAKKCEEM